MMMTQANCVDCLRAPLRAHRCWGRSHSGADSRRRNLAKQLLLTACAAVLCRAIYDATAASGGTPVLSAHAAAPSDVLVVTEDNFKAELRKGPMLLEFYTPVRCGAVA